MFDKDVIETLLMLKEIGSGFALMFWGAFLVKKYIINGSLTRLFGIQEAKLRQLMRLNRNLKKVLEHQERLNEVVSNDKQPT